MIKDYVPFITAIVSAVVAGLVAWLTSIRTVRLEKDKLRLSTQQLAFSKLLEIRITAYPKLYVILSDLLKAGEKQSIVSVQLTDMLQWVNEWDSQHAIFLSTDALNACYAFRQNLMRAAQSPGTPGLSDSLLQAAARLELALRSDLGVHGIELANGDLTPRGRQHY